MERLLDVVLEQARPSPEPGAEAPSDPAAAIRSIALLLERRAAQSEVAIELRLAEPLPPVALEDDALRQVLLNLAQNAVEASPRGGRVRIEASVAAASLVVEVEDEGAGVPEELRQRIFEPFVSTRQRGSGGLGLAISRRIVEEAGAQIALVDLAGGGSCFRLELPLRSAG